MQLRARIETALLPTVPLSGGSGPSSPPPSWLGRLLRPRLVADLEGVPVFDLAPWGPPGPTSWPAVVGVLAALAAAVLALAGVGAVALARGWRRPR